MYCMLTVCCQQVHRPQTGWTSRGMMLTPDDLTASQSDECPWAGHTFSEPLWYNFSLPSPKGHSFEGSNLRLFYFTVPPAPPTKKKELGKKVVNQDWELVREASQTLGKKNDSGIKTEADLSEERSIGNILQRSQRGHWGNRSWSHGRSSWGLDPAAVKESRSRWPSQTILEGWLGKKAIPALREELGKPG